MLRYLEASKKNLETLVEEHKKKLKTSSDDKELARIIDEEIKNAYGYLSMITKTIYDLSKVKYRLETLIYVEEPLRILPEVLEELRLVEPLVEKINPQLINQIRALEQRVAGIIAMSSSYIPGITGTLQQALTTSRQKEPVTSEVVRQALREEVKQSLVQNQVKPSIIESEKAAPTPVLEKPIPVQLPPVSEQVKGSIVNQVEEKATVASVPLHVVEQWILSELNASKGVLDVALFEKKYGVKRDKVLEALRSLEAKNLVRVRRR